eukprot:g2385.t1
MYYDRSSKNFEEEPNNKKHYYHSEQKDQQDFGETRTDEDNEISDEELSSTNSKSMATFLFGDSDTDNEGEYRIDDEGEYRIDNEEDYHTNNEEDYQSNSEGDYHTNNEETHRTGKEKVSVDSHVEQKDTEKQHRSSSHRKFGGYVGRETIEYGWELVQLNAIVSPYRYWNEKTMHYSRFREGGGREKNDHRRRGTRATQRSSSSSFPTQSVPLRDIQIHTLERLGKMLESLVYLVNPTAKNGNDGRTHDDEFYWIDYFLQCFLLDNQSSFYVCKLFGTTSNLFTNLEKQCHQLQPGHVLSDKELQRLLLSSNSLALFPVSWPFPLPVVEKITALINAFTSNFKYVFETNIGQQKSSIKNHLAKSIQDQCITKIVERTLHALKQQPPVKHEKKEIIPLHDPKPCLSFLQNVLKTINALEKELLDLFDDQKNRQDEDSKRTTTSSSSSSIPSPSISLPSPSKIQTSCSTDDYSYLIEEAKEKLLQETVKELSSFMGKEVLDLHFTIGTNDLMLPQFRDILQSRETIYYLTCHFVMFFNHFYFYRVLSKQNSSDQHNRKKTKTFEREEVAESRLNAFVGLMDQTLFNAEVSFRKITQFVFEHLPNIVGKGEGARRDLFLIKGVSSPLPIRDPTTHIGNVSHAAPGNMSNAAPGNASNAAPGNVSNATPTTHLENVFHALVMLYNNFLPHEKDNKARRKRSTLSTYHDMFACIWWEIAHLLNNHLSIVCHQSTTRTNHLQELIFQWSERKSEKRRVQETRFRRWSELREERGRVFDKYSQISVFDKSNSQPNLEHDSVSHSSLTTISRTALPPQFANINVFMQEYRHKSKISSTSLPTPVRESRQQVDTRKPVGTRKPVDMRKPGRSNEHPIVRKSHPSLVSPPSAMNSSPQETTAEKKIKQKISEKTNTRRSPPVSRSSTKIKQKKKSNTTGTKKTTMEVVHNKKRRATSSLPVQQADSKLSDQEQSSDESSVDSFYGSD